MSDLPDDPAGNKLIAFSCLAMELVANPETGGLAGLADAFKREGLGEVMASWIGRGHNRTISTDQIEQVVSPDAIQGIAVKINLKSEEIAAHLATVLPLIIDQLTPMGSIPDESMIQEGVCNLRKNMLGT